MKWTYDISNETKRATVHCENNFACLEDNGRPVCTIKSTISNDILFVECKDGLNCPYARPIGDRKVCICPTRTEVYKKRKS
jgi:hypothetical protein